MVYWRWSLVLTVVSLASFVATQGLAFEARWTAALGPPWLWLGQLPLYAPWAGWAWAWQYRVQPLAPFLRAGVVLAGLVLLGTVSLWTRKQRPAPEARWATRRDL